jgi:hypothetical protein
MPDTAMFSQQGKHYVLMQFENLMPAINVQVTLLAPGHKPAVYHRYEIKQEVS